MKHSTILAIGTLSGFLAVTSTVLGANWTTLATTGNLYWTNNANWDASYPNAPGAVANIAANFTTNTSILLGRNLTVGTLNIGDTTADYGTTGVWVNVTGDGNFTLTFEGATNGAPTLMVIPANMLQRTWYNADCTFSSAIRLGGASPLSIVATGDLSLAALDLGGNTLNLESPASTAVIALGGEMAGTTNAHLIHNSLSSAATTVAKYNTNFTGTVILNGGNLQYVISGTPNARELLFHEGGTLTVGNSSTGNTVAPGQCLSSNLWTFMGGQLTYGGTRLNGVVPFPLSSDSVDTLALVCGDSKMALGSNAGTTGTVLFVKSLTRMPGATLVASGGGTTGELGAPTNVLLRGAQIQVTGTRPGMVGAGGAEGTKTMSVYPWLFCRNNSGSNQPDAIGTYGTNGLRGLYVSECDTTLVGSADRNVIATDVALSSNQTVNTLVCNYANAKNIGAGKKLTVTRGAVLMTSSTTSRIGEITNATAGTLDFGPAEGIVYASGTDTDLHAIGAVITGSGGFTKCGPGRLRLTANNTYSGTNTVTAGILQVGEAAAAPASASANLGSGDVVVCDYAKLVIAQNVTNAIRDTASVALRHDGLGYGKLQIDGVMTAKVHSLYLGGIQQPAGTYGCSTNLATSQFTNDFHFAGLGVLAVASGPTQLPFVGTVVIMR